ncbi:MAG TPA: response regulator [Vicinamibacterales bacterium]|jgi:DNA-binding LytR/AlgR family response regulator
MKVLIVDDEAHARRRLASMLEEIDQSETSRIEIVGEAADGMTALALVRETQPDLILLDIAMPEVDGLDVVRHLPDPRPLVIFQTAYHEYALQAFDHQALDYVVKPVKRERLAQALERARTRLATLERARLWQDAPLERIGSAFARERVRPARLLVRHGAGHRLLAVRDVIRFTSVDGLTFAQTPADRPVADYTLGELESRLGAGFVRASRSDLVNLEHVQGIAGNGDGSATLTLTGGVSVHVSRRRAADVKRAIG